MSPIQILTLAIAIVFPALGVMGTIAAVLYSNKRIDDARSDFGQRIDDAKTNLGNRMDSLEKQMEAMEKRLIQHLDNAFAHMELLLELHEAKHHKP